MKVKRALCIAVWILAAPVAGWTAGFTAQVRPATTATVPLSWEVQSVTVDCSWPVGAVVLVPAAVGGNGNPITWTLTAGGPTFAADPATGIISVAQAMPASMCGTAVQVNLEMTQAAAARKAK